MSNCLSCDKQLIFDKNKRQKKFCSIKCSRDYHYQEYITRWLEGKEDGLKGASQLSNHIKRWLIEQRGELCWRCGWCEKHPIDERVPVEVDHIDGDYKNNSPNNLRLLCPNCHSLTPTYKSRNKGRGRHSRRERYAEGKSH